MNKERTLLSAEAILMADDIKYREVDVTEWWGGFVRVRSLTGEERDEYEASLVVGKGKDRDITLRNARARMVFLSAVDQEGKRMFTNQQNVLELGKKNAGALDKIFGVCQELSGLRKEDMDAMLGNSETVPSDGSTSD